MTNFLSTIKCLLGEGECVFLLAFNVRCFIFKLSVFHKTQWKKRAQNKGPFQSTRDVIAKELMYRDTVSHPACEYAHRKRQEWTVIENLFNLIKERDTERNGQEIQKCLFVIFWHITWWSPVEKHIHQKINFDFKNLLQKKRKLLIASKKLF